MRSLSFSRYLPLEEPPEGSPYPSLLVKYTLIAIYGIGNAIVGVTTLDLVAGEAWALAWPVLVALLSLGALSGVLRSRRRKRFGLELVTTLLLLALLAGYSLAVVIRGVTLGEPRVLPTGLLPIILAVFPWRRLSSIVRAGGVGWWR